MEFQGFYTANVLITLMQSVVLVSLASPPASDSGIQLTLSCDTVTLDCATGEGGSRELAHWFFCALAWKGHTSFLLVFYWLQRVWYIDTLWLRTEKRSRYGCTPEMPHTQIPQTTFISFIILLEQAFPLGLTLKIPLIYSNNVFIPK